MTRVLNLFNLLIVYSREPCCNMLNVALLEFAIFANVSRIFIFEVCLRTSISQEK
jgi:hypothetical protein